MKKILIAAIAVIMPTTIMAQSAIEAYNLSQNDLRGTARFMSMAGAFGALGGDLSTLNQNPAGIGIYRSSEIGATVDFNFMSSNTYNGAKTNNTHVYCPSVGYIGAFNLRNETMPFFQWGISYSRQASFDRTVRGNINDLGTSLSNFIAYSSNGYDPNELGQSDDFNPYTRTNCEWLSILAYNGYAINPIGNTSEYQGLFAEGYTVGDASYDIRQRGKIDEYSINFGGNVIDVVYWGLGLGINDIYLAEETYYDETLYDADVANVTESGTEIIPGDAYNSLGYNSRITGSGFNIKLGLIVKPINELRIGVAVHTPTWYHISHSRRGDLYYEYYDIGAKDAFNWGTAEVNNGEGSYFDWKLRSPWKFMVSAATVLGGRFIASADYEINAMNDMRVSDHKGFEDALVTNDIKNYFKTQHNVRVGLEYRITPSFSVRCGYGNVFSAVKDGVNEGDVDVYTNGRFLDNTNPAYTFTNNTRYLTCGLGYRYKKFYVDAAYVNKYRTMTYHPFSSFGDVYGPWGNYSISENNLVVSLGYKF